MNDDFAYHPDLDESRSKLWTPSPAMRGRLLLGAMASVAYGGLVAAAALTARAQDEEQAMPPALFLLWASAIPAAGILWAYLGVAREVGSHSLRKSSWCAFGVIFLWQIAIVTAVGQLPDWGEALILCAIAVGSFSLLILAFHSSNAPAVAGTDAANTSPSGSKAGWGGAGLALLFLVKIASKFLLQMGLRQGMWEAIVLMFLLACTIGFLVRFAICKIQLRVKLGGMATIVGVAEIAGLIGAGVVLLCAILAIQEVAQAVGHTEKDLEDLQRHWVNTSLLFTASVSLAWTTLTALLFVILWHRHDPEADWLRDWQNAEMGY
jgi:hypothetical protein